MHSQSRPGANEGASDSPAQASRVVAANEASASADWWHGLYLKLGGLAIVFAVGAVGAQIVASRKSEWAIQVKDEVIADKDRSQKTNSDGRDVEVNAAIRRANESVESVRQKGVELSRETALAKERALALEKDALALKAEAVRANEAADAARAAAARSEAKAAAASLEAEQLRKESQFVLMTLTPRLIDSRVATAKLAPFAGMTAYVEYAPDRECGQFAGELADVLKASGWAVLAERFEDADSFAKGVHVKAGLVSLPNDVPTSLDPTAALARQAFVEMLVANSDEVVNDGFDRDVRGSALVIRIGPKNDATALAHLRKLQETWLKDSAGGH